jgi:hypothetical protein
VRVGYVLSLSLSRSPSSRQSVQWSRGRRTVWKRALLLKGEQRASGLIPETQQEASGPLCVCVCVFLVAGMDSKLYSNYKIWMHDELWAPSTFVKLQKAFNSWEGGREGIQRLELFGSSVSCRRLLAFGHVFFIFSFPWYMWIFIMLLLLLLLFLSLVMIVVNLFGFCRCF